MTISHCLLRPTTSSLSGVWSYAPLGVRVDSAFLRVRLDTAGSLFPESMTIDVFDVDTTKPEPWAELQALVDYWKPARVGVQVGPLA